MTSEHRWQREQAALDLRKLTENGNVTVARDAEVGLGHLSSDPERLVRESAQAALDDATRSHFERGLALAGSGDLVNADAEFQKVTESSTAELTAFAHFNRAVLAAAANKTEDAIGHYTVALQSGQPEAAARAALNLGCLHELAGRLKEAMSMYQAAMNYHDRAVEPRAAFLLGRLQEKRGELSAAWLSYATASDYDGHPFLAAAESRYQALIRFAEQCDALRRVLSLSGYPNPAIPTQSENWWRRG